jgi:hypothetical protein
MKNEIATQRQTINCLRVWQSSGVWKLHQHIKIAFRKKRRAGELGECLLPFDPESLFFQVVVKNIKIKIQGNIILSVLFCGCETCYLTLKEEHRLKLLENRVLRKILGRKKVEVNEGLVELALY